MQTRQRA